MKVYCTRPNCPRPINHLPDLDDVTILKTTQQKYCMSCGMPLLLDGRYVTTQLLGKGGFGAAFLAGDRRIPGMRSCVVKQFQPAGNLTSTQLQLAQQLFEREAEVLAQIGNEHEQIPDLFAFFPVSVSSLPPGKQEQFFYLVQEYIDGQNLEEELLQEGKFSEIGVTQILTEILPVLTFIHEKGIIHRDIKPSNIMRRRDGKLFLLDFGAVKQVANIPGASTASTGIYSLGFAPPEQMSGNQVFPSTDLYALAVTVISLLTGHTNQWKWRNQATVSNQLADILDRMLLPAANQRFESAAEVLQALDVSTPSIIPTTLPKSIPQPPTTQPQPPTQPPIPPPPTFASWELLAGAAFSGFEGALIAIALFSLLKNPIITMAISVVILSGLIFAQSQRWLEKFDLLIIPALTFAIIFFIPFLHSGLVIQMVIILPVVSALIAIAVTSIFRLIYRLISSII